VRNKIEQTVNRLLSEVKGIRIAIFAHGDYQDKPQTYDTKWLDFTSDKNAITSFVKNVSSTCGYDSDECYELVLRQVLQLLIDKSLFMGGGGADGLLISKGTDIFYRFLIRH